MKNQIFVAIGLAIVASVLVTGLASTIYAQSNMTGGNMTGQNMTGGNMRCPPQLVPQVKAGLDFEDHDGAGQPVRHRQRLRDDYAGGAAYPVSMKIAASADVSREHARVRFDPGTAGYYLIPPSAPGTTVNGVRVPRGYDDAGGSKRENGVEFPLARWREDRAGGHGVSDVPRGRRRGRRRGVAVTALLYGRLFLLTTLVALAACFLWVHTARAIAPDSADDDWPDGRWRHRCGPAARGQRGPLPRRRRPRPLHRRSTASAARRPAARPPTSRCRMLRDAARARDRPGRRSRPRGDHHREQRDPPRWPRSRPGMARHGVRAHGRGGRGRRATVGHVGDTRLYKLAARRHREDHARSFAGRRARGRARDLRARGDAASAAQRGLSRRRLRAARAGRSPTSSTSHEIPFEPDAALLLCSDGLTDLVAVDDDRAARASGSPAIRTRSSRALIDAANDAGGKDNVTGVFVEGDRFGRGAACRRPAGAGRGACRATLRRRRFAV